MNVGGGRRFKGTRVPRSSMDVQNVWNLKDIPEK